MRTRTSVSIFIVLVPMLLLPAAACARTWNVPNDAATIQAGIDSASAGDTVLVECGTYLEREIYPKSGVVLTSETGLAGCVTIDVQDSTGGFRCTDLDSTTVIKGFTMFRSNLTGDGGGAYLLNSDLTIINCDFDSCSGNRGGGMFISSSSPTLVNCSFTGNDASVQGGAFWCVGSQLILTGCGFYGNTADEGGVAQLLSGTDAAIDSCTFSDNYSFRTSGAIRIWNATADFTDCIFTRNTGQVSSYGGALHCDAQSVTSLTGCVFSGNSASNGGALGVEEADAMDITGCTFYGDSCLATGGTITFYNSSPSYIENTLIAFSRSGRAIYVNSTAVSLTCCDIFGNDGGDYYGYIEFWYGVNGNFSENPYFCNAPAGDLRLKDCSPCLDAPGCGLVGALGAGPSPRTIHVPGDFGTIQAALNAACPDDTVLVACGTYYEHDIIMTSGAYLTSETGEPDCVTIDADSLGSVIHCVDVDGEADIVGLTLTHGWAVQGGGVKVDSSAVSISNCHLVENTGTNIGGAVCAFGLLGGSGSDVTLTGCLIERNRSGSAGGGAMYYCSGGTIENCTFYWNWSLHGGGICSNNPDPGFTITNSIIASSTEGGAVYCYPGEVPTFTCTDIYGNAGGDWTGCIAGQAGVYGNISEDPLFCNAPGGNLYLAGSSPCLHAVCGPMGAFGRGCFGPKPYITGVSDVGNDQGRQARLAWERSEYDEAGSGVEITGYTIFRRQDEFLAGQTAAFGHPGTAHMDWHGDYPALKAAGWDEVGHVSVRGDSLYQAVVPTLCDSTDQGVCWSVFMVSAVSSDPYTFFDSYPDSGYSIDNLAPAPPPDLTMTSPVALEWEEVPDEDFAYYSVYGSALPALDGSAILIGYTAGTAEDITGHVHDYYHVTATDFSGNEGEESTVGNTYAGIPDRGPQDIDDLPTAFALREGRPNPFDTATLITFDLPESRHVSLTVFDARGRAVRVLTDGEYEAGRHSAVWDGLGESGSTAATGVYFIRMEAGGFTAMKKVMLLR